MGSVRYDAAAASRNQNSAPSAGRMTRDAGTSPRAVAASAARLRGSGDHEPDCSSSVDRRERERHAVVRLVIRESARRPAVRHVERGSAGEERCGVSVLAETEQYRRRAVARRRHRSGSEDASSCRVLSGRSIEIRAFGGHAVHSRRIDRDAAQQRASPQGGSCSTDRPAGMHAHRRNTRAMTASRPVAPHRTGERVVQQAWGAPARKRDREPAVIVDRARCAASATQPATSSATACGCSRTTRSTETGSPYGRCQARPSRAMNACDSSGPHVPDS